MNIAWKILLALGLLVGVLALGMDTTVPTGSGRVHNLGLLSDRLVLLVLGGFLVLAGVILFGMSRLKQTREEEEAARRQANVALSKSVAEFDKALTASNSWIDRATDQAGWRLMMGLFAGLFASVVGGATFGQPEAFFLVALASYFWPSAAHAAIRWVSLVWAVGGLLLLLAAVGNRAASVGEVLERRDLWLSFVIGLGFVTAFVLLAIFARPKKPRRQPNRK